jgi:hypothetical protein
VIIETLTCVTNSWQPRIGDPTAIGWITSAAYQLAAIASVFAWREAPAGFGTERSAYRTFWLMAAALLFALGINKQLDLQSALTAAGRCVSQLSGWYGQRRIVQAGFILVAGLLALIGLIWCAMKFKPVMHNCWLALVGLAFLMGFVMIRAMSFHHMDALIDTRISGLRLNGILELGGILAITANALWHIMGQSNRSRRSGELGEKTIRSQTGSMKPMDFS